MSQENEDKDLVDVKSLKIKRAMIKRRITGVFKKLSTEVNLNVPVLKNLIISYLKEVTIFDEKISDLLVSEGGSEEDFSEDTILELDKQVEYTASIETKLAELDNPPETGLENSSETSVSNAAHYSLKLPELKCETFSGEGTSNLQFHSFLTQFDNIIGLRSNISNATKFTYLKTYLRGYALKLVQHLQVSDDNYEVALELLTKEFLNKDSLINDLFAKLLTLKPKSNCSHLDIKVFLNEVRCILSDLKAYDIDLFTEGAGNALISHIVFNKLPQSFKQELGRKLQNNFPKLQEVFANYVEVIQTLQLRDVPLMSKPKSDTIIHSYKYRNESLPRNFQNPASVNASNAFDGFKNGKNCKFCTCFGHSMLHCRKYPDHQSRISRCKVFKMCFNCSSSRHVKKKCGKPLDFECKYCKSNKHISALCSKFTAEVMANYCINSSSNSGKTFLLPTITVRVGSGNKTTLVKCLIDTGSQRSYVNKNVLKRLSFANVTNNTDVEISTFINSSVKSFAEVCLTVDLGEGCSFPVPLLVNADFDVTFSIEGLKEAHENLQSKYKVAEQFTGETIHLEGLLGVDCIQYLQQCDIVPCMGGKAFKLHKGYVPFGNVDSFLNDKQLVFKYRNIKQLSKHSTKISESVNNVNKSVISKENLDSALINFVLDPVKSYYDPLGGVMTDSLVDHNLDRMFSSESLGIAEETNSYDLDQISKFNENISFLDGHYHVVLPWTDKINEVKDNFAISRAILDKVTSQLYAQNLYEQYEAVLNQQLAEDILEPLSLDNLNVNQHVWIPHRHVVKTQDNVTTKLRIVLNCSLKVGDAPSLNEAAYPGVDLMNDLLTLLLKIRSYKYFVSSDIKQAFLMIKLKDVNDRNKFSILWRGRNGELLAYRYKAIVFGFISSPFILHNVIRFHLQKYPDDYCNHVLNQNTYVDNVFATANDVPSLLALYHESFQRMAEGGFELRSWISNSEELQEVFHRDGRDPSHTCHEKMLGYHYFPQKDKFILAEFQLSNANVPTKRTVLSDIAKIFDPLGISLPVVVKAKLLLCKLWQAKLDWDEPLGEFSAEWLKIQLELPKLCSLEFPRQAYSGDVSMYIFCDSSKLMYGFTCYVKTEDNQVNLLFAKAKTAPIKNKSLPTLELLSVFLAMKCLPTILKSFSVNVKEIILCVDAQVVLAWIITGKVKAKNIFASNRLKEVLSFQRDIESNYNAKCQFKYVPTDVNPADLLTRGLSFKQFSQKLDFWLHGPNFIQGSTVKFPTKTLGCLPDENKVVACNASTSNLDSIIPVNTYSNVHKLFRITTLVLKFICKLKRVTVDPMQLSDSAKLYWLKQEQARYYSSVVDFLNASQSKFMPPVVRLLNLFLDERGVIRCRGRLEKSDLDYEVRNPVLLHRDSFLSHLLVWDAHLRCEHLGIGSTLSKLRTGGIWIPKGRAFVKRTIHKCVTCKRLNSGAFKYPKPADFLRDRVKYCKHFQNTGIDFTGHVYVKQHGVLVKNYILVLTC